LGAAVLQWWSSCPDLIVPKRKKAVVMPQKTPVPDHSQSVDDDSKSREQLKAELEYLRMENAYLKKLEEVREVSKRSHPGKKPSP
jgi:transposase